MFSRYGDVWEMPIYGLFRFQIKDDIKAARKKATKAYSQYVEEPSTKPTKIAL
jgi:hypothetical protein